jgi:hypothetical protein
MWPFGFPFLKEEKIKWLFFFPYIRFEPLFLKDKNFFRKRKIGLGT